MTGSTYPLGADFDAPAPRRVRTGVDPRLLGRQLRRARLGIAAWPVARRDRLWGWIGPLLLTLLSFALRLTGVTHPFRTVDSSGNLVGYFDETYYARDAHSLLLHGVELQGTASGQFVVHPPLGKWMIAVGEWIFGYNELGMRISSVVIGSLTILIFARLVRRVTRSTFYGLLGGLLLSLDALEFVQSRISTLDIFLLFWIVACLACLVADRDHRRRRLATRLEDGTHGAGAAAGPRTGWRWWLVGAGLCIGAASSVKWSAAPYIVVFALLVYAWDVGARRSLGITSPGLGALQRDTLPILGVFLVLPAVVYTLSWTGWFVTSGGYDRHDQGRSGVVGTVENWVNYHRAALCFHEGLTNTPTKKDSLLCGVDESKCTKATRYDNPLDSYCYSSPSSHPYESKPFGWFTLSRPVAYAYDSVKAGDSIQGQKCVTTDPNGCSREILAVNTPVLWWGGLLCVIACAGLWAARRDWRAALVLVGVAAGFFPWLQNTQRVMFQFYALPMLPFVVLAVVLVAERAMAGAPTVLRRHTKVRSVRRVIGVAAVSLFVAAVLADFWWLHPVLAADVIPYTAWHDRVVTILGFPHWV